MYRNNGRGRTRILPPAEPKKADTRGEPVTNISNSFTKYVEREEPSEAWPNTSIASTTSSSSTQSPARGSGFLDGVMICLIPLKLHAIRIKLLEKRLEESGAVSVTFCRKTGLSSNCTHALIDEGVEMEELLVLFAAISLMDIKEQIGRVSFVRSKWLSTCLSSKSRKPEVEHCVNAHLVIIIDGKLNSKKTKRSRSPNLESDIKQPQVIVVPVAVTSTSRNNSPERKKPRPEPDVSSYDDSDANEGDLSDEEEDATTAGASISPIVSRMASKFACSQASSSKEKNLNGHITGPLEELAAAHQNSGETWRVMAYGKPISALKNCPKHVIRIEDLAGMRNIGTSIKNKIGEILETGACQKVTEMCQDNESNQAVTLFCGIHGVSVKTASKWASRGLRTLDDVKDKIKLGSSQTIGMKHYHDFQQRIPRDEVVEIELTVKQAALELQDGLEIVTCGSYRRGKPTCGDVDILITHSDGKSHRAVFAALLQKLHDIGFLTDDLLISDEGTQKKYLGVCLLPGEGRKHRRLDIIVVPYSEMACALLYFTGSAHFNRSMRAYAHRLNMALSHHSLNRNVIRVKKEKVNDGEPVVTLTEKSVFDILGIPYLQPEDRDH